jgi:hypothetical protein
LLDDMLNRTKVENPKELFVHKLGAALTMENTVEEMLGNLITKAVDNQLKQQLRHHREETQAQIRNLRQAFSTLGMEPRERPCPAIDGIEKEGESNLGMADESLHDAIILAGAADDIAKVQPAFDGDSVVREGGAVLFLDETASAVLEDKTLDVHAHGDHFHFSIDEQEGG